VQRAWLPILIMLAVPATGAWAEGPAEPAAEADGLPSPDADLPKLVKIRADPPQVRLQGPRERFGLLVSGETADGRRVDATAAAEYEVSDASIVSIDRKGTLLAGRDGSTVVRVRVGDHGLQVPVEVHGSAGRERFDFAADVEPLLSRYGCNSSGCHGKAEGQNGLKLSVFGFDPRADYEALVMQARGRRVFPADPRRSLLLQKASGAVPHGGGARMPQPSEAYRVLHGWVAAGAPFQDGEPSPVARIELSPAERVMVPGGRQQLRVVAHFEDGRQTDVTHLSQFQSNSESLVSVDEHGLISAGARPGGAAVMASFRGAVDVCRVLLPRPKPLPEGAEFTAANFIDEHVNRRLRKLKIAPSPPASDAEFLRRVYLDVIGTLPTAEEARDFLGDQRPDRRALLVERLLDREQYADYWALKWSDLLRVDRQALGHQGAYAYYRWIRQSIAQGKPLDAMARQLLTAAGPLAESPQGHFFEVVSTPGEMASTLSQVFLGVRIACAECHHHPYDRWSQQDFYGMRAYFTQVKRKSSDFGQVVLAEGNPTSKHPRSGAPVYPYMLATAMPEEAPQGDRRQELAAKFASPENPWFARNLANRLFAHFLGRGLVEPVDDFRLTNPPSNPELLDALAQELIEHDFDARHLIRVIVASAAYQRSAEPNETNRQDEQNYSRGLLRPLPAEVLFDAVCQVTDRGEKFDGVPYGSRAIQLWDSQVQHYFLKLFGRPTRVTPCQCERNSEPSLGQVLHLMNSPEVDGKLRHPGGRVARLVAGYPSDAELSEALYLWFLSRRPTEEETQVAVKHLQAAEDRRAAAEDLAWSLLNSLEFVLNH